jgi:hypothetical protein
MGLCYDGRNAPEHIALASTVAPTLGLVFAESIYNPGFYDLKIETLSGGYLGYSPTTGSMVWNEKAGPTTGIWRTDGCDGAMVMTHEGQTYHFATDENNYVVARPETTTSVKKRYTIKGDKFTPFAMRNKATEIAAT